jgi:cell division protein FtsI/penicillin-binding protein 2
MKRSSPLALILPASALLIAGVAFARSELAAPLPAPAAAPPVELAALSAPGSAAQPAPAASGAPAVVPATLHPAPLAPSAPSAQTPAPALGELGEPRYDPALGRYVAPLGDRRAVLTLDPRLQARLEKTLADSAVPWGVTVLLEPATGRVLAMAEHSAAEPARRGLALTAMAPAASVFKIVTAAALLERGVKADDEVCYHGGKHRLQPRLLADDPRRDRRCLTLRDALGHSANVVFAKLAGRGLEPAQLRSAAGRFLFGTEIPFSRRVEVSPALIPDGGFELATTAAGFGPVRLSPLHGALIASVVANGGLLVPPTLVDEVQGAATPVPAAPRRVVDEGVAGALADMMRTTVTEGTARKAFRRGGGALRGVSVAGKTGSLTDPEPYRDYSWFVGYAPVDHPEVAIATLVVNGHSWRVRAPTVAREALEAFFAGRVAATPSRGIRTAKAPAP